MKGLAGTPFLVALALFSAGATAADGTVTHLLGTLSVTKADGSVRLLSRNSKIESGDTLSTQRESFAQIEFADGARLTLKPGTSVKIERFSYAEEKPQDDAFFYSLLKGGLRAVAGVVGERSADRYQLRTAGGTVAVRHTDAGCAGGPARCAGPDGAVRVSPADAEAIRRAATVSIYDCASSRSSECTNLAEAVFVAVADGEVVVRNPQGEVGLSAGQSGAATQNQRPIFLATDPGLQFTPPATFIQSIMSGSFVNLGKNLECSVAR
jgi:hypothetical protein